MVAPESGKFEDVKALVLRSLETTGTLAQIRAQLRVCVFKAIENKSEIVEASAGSTSSGSSPAQKLRTNPKTGVLLAELVAEFLEFYGFRHSLSVFLPESQLGKTRRGRNETAADAGISKVGLDSSIIEQLIACCRVDGSDGIASAAGAPRAADMTQRTASWSRLPPLSDPPSGAKKLGANAGDDSWPHQGVLPVSPPVSPKQSQGLSVDGDRKQGKGKEKDKDKEKEKAKEKTKEKDKEKDTDKTLALDAGSTKDKKQEVEAKTPVVQSTPASKDVLASSGDTGDSLGSGSFVDEVLSEVDEEIATSSAISGASLGDEDLGFGASEDLGSDALDGGASKVLPSKGALRRRMDPLEVSGASNTSASAVLDGTSVGVDISVDSQEIENCDFFERVIMPNKT